MSFIQYVDELNELNKQIRTKSPVDVIQFCANYFNNRLEEQRKALWEQKSKAEAAGINLFPSGTQIKELQENRTVPSFKTPFSDNDPHSAADHGAPAKLTTDAAGLFRGVSGEGSNPFGASAPVDPSDPGAKRSTPQSTVPGAGFAATIAKLPTTFNANRRTSVSAEAMNPDTFSGDNWKPPVHNFSPEQLERLNASVAKNFLFSQLDEESLRTVIFALEEKKAAQGTNIILQGDEGDFFYVVERGTVDFYVNGAKVNSSGAGSSFGELALMYNSPRAATAVAETDCILWALDRMTFRRILLEGTAKKRSMYEGFLKEVPVLSALSSYERNKLADALGTESYAIGENVVTEGEAGENFYFIEAGTAEIIKEDEGVIGTLQKGDYFGELALLHDSPRQATVTATSPLKVVTLGKSGFQRLLGPAVEILKRQDPTKH
ncbi:unnamed protein product [Kuraishia capsulata CBS 1993]|uniref:cAMP-dependent protein kinase regulatory subunit n=1 Tax=Kuraishia capsulata CBS 1993 TaxID=1382522 RepID=W6MTG1_9ASCO|nr:uncharacterized protein KUCA_T00001002001 [Kuraishia capsulata CBS 1993]CDK25035.1 unnamed protein product [Kuraishia capsulata CBS 1993]